MSTCRSTFRINHGESLVLYDACGDCNPFGATQKMLQHMRFIQVFPLFLDNRKDSVFAGSHPCGTNEPCAKYILIAREILQK